MSNELLSRIENLVELYHCEFMGHLQILLAGDIELSDKIFKKRQELDLEIRNLLLCKIGQER